MNKSDNLSPPRKPDITEEMLSGWQTILDLMARIVGVPAGLIMKMDPPQIEVLVASATEGNPYKQGERADLNTGLYCETVMAQRSPLLVPNALKDPDWDHNPDIELGMISYLGFPLQWPDGEIFGTICVLDSKENQYNRAYVDLMSQFKELVEAQLGLLHARHHLEDLVEDRTRELKDAKEQLQQNLAETNQAKLKLEESEKRFRNFMDNNPAVAYIKNEAGQHIYGNRTLFDRFDTALDEFIGTTTHDFFPQTIANKIEAYDELVRTKAAPVDTDDWGQEWQGRVRWWKEIKFPLAGPSGETLVGGIAFDITERKQAEEKLQEAFSEIKQLKDRLQQENIYLREEIELRHKHEEIMGKSDAIKKALNQAEQVADTDSTVLILGETGTGKELLARTIHNLSSRKGRPMVKVNCAALPSTLIESELFGREKGAYTGALTKQVGRFEVADGSTIFLDEISELPFDLQAKLLRVLEEGQFERLGSSKTIQVDVRVIAATNRDLAKALQQGKFREDLYYRLNVFPITVPPLPERREDIPLLVWAFVKEFEQTMGKTIERIPRKNMDALQRYSWPGNVRELRNAIERAMILSKSSTVQVDLPKISDSTKPQSVTLEELERRHILGVLERTSWRVRGKNGAAEILGLKPTTLDSRIKKLGIQRRPSA